VQGESFLRFRATEDRRSRDLLSVRHRRPRGLRSTFTTGASKARKRGASLIEIKSHPAPAVILLYVTRGTGQCQSPQPSLSPVSCLRSQRSLLLSCGPTSRAGGPSNTHDAPETKQCRAVADQT